MANGKHTGATNGHATNGHATNGNGKHPSVKRSDFAKDPGRYVDQARDSGPVTITDAKGKPRVMIVVPKAVTAFHED